MNPPSRGRIVLVEDHPLFAEAMETALTLEGYDARRLALVNGVTRAQMVTGALRLRPGTILLDLDLGKYGSGLPLIQPFIRAGVNVVVVTASDDPVRWGEALASGARKVLLKSAQLDEVLTTIRRIDNGLPLMPDEERRRLIQEWRLHVAEEQEIHRRLSRLTRRESEVLALLMTGRQVGEIARTCFVSESTVRTQVKSILAKLQVRSQLAAVGLAHQAGWRQS